MAAPPPFHHASGDAHYQQRVWKVSSTLDRLAMMCEQHHLQTKHVDGQPDWATHTMPAGVKTHDHRDAPANFAWAPSPPKNHVPVVTTLRDEDEVDIEHLEEKRDTLRASTRDMLSRLSLSSTDSLNIAGGQATHETVRPLSMAQQADMMKPTLTARMPVVERPSFRDEHGSRLRSNASSGDLDTLDSVSRVPASAFPHHALNPHRRRKVHFADHERSYRGARPKKLSDLTYHEAMSELASKTSRPGRQSSTSALTTYQANYQWPRREDFEKMMDKVGGETAGGDTRYEPRRVFTADEAMRVANDVAVDFHSRRHFPNQVSETSALDGADEVKSDTIRARTSSTSEGTTVKSPILPVAEELRSLHVPAHIDSDPNLMSRSAGQEKASQESTARGSVHPHDTAMLDLHARRTKQHPSGAHPVSMASVFAMTDRVNHGGLIVTGDDEPSQASQNPEMIWSRTHDVGVMTTPIRVAEVSTQTYPFQKHVTENAATPQSGYCSHCGRSSDPVAVQSSSTAGPKVALASSTAAKKLSRLTRSDPPSHRYNPIFANARFPPEPPGFRGKTTYSSEFGTKRNPRR